MDEHATAERETREPQPDCRLGAPVPNPDMNDMPHRLRSGPRSGAGTGRQPLGNRIRGEPPVSILLGTLNGARYLPAQLQSYLDQSHANWTLHVSDDGSADETLDILEHFRMRTSRDVWISTGLKQGFAANFLSLICDRRTGEGFVAFSDQDDVWLPRKLERALHALQSVPAAVPAVYGGRTQIVDSTLAPIRLSRLFRRPPSFRNAILQNISGGNTMVLNPAAVRLVRQAGADLDPVSHDWWIYQLITGHGGSFIYDPEPHVLYRQHGGNLVGENQSLFALRDRLQSLRNGRYWSWLDRNLDALQRNQDLLAPGNRRLVAELTRLVRASFAQRCTTFFRLGIHRQRACETWLLSLALLARGGEQLPAGLGPDRSK